ncbi:MAG: 2-oxoglutarate dehydrogenase, E2 component, dihydrolipoamide succinyltransferase [Candidatus Nanopelagicales bacterium]|nr:2-oxoglutarate dehydrogenase, E2 component, dihydrolipoamide succinyltransferase [Candidatus Nanopelagicales bacterium]
MSVSVKMPQLGESVTEGTITRWLKNIGDHVNADEPLVEISTDKVDTEIPSPVTGILLSLAAQEDDVVEVGAELALIGEESEVDAPAEAPAPVAPPAEAPAPVAPPAAPPVTPPVAAEEAAPAPAPAAAGAESIIVLPALGESVTEGTITRWLKSEGDAVAVDEPIVEISTDKVDTEIPAAVAGVLIKITAPEDSVIEVGGELGRIGSSVAATPAPAAPTAPTAPAPAAPTAPTAPASAAPAESTQSGYVTPLVRRMASDAGVDLTTVTGTGAGGRITKTDVVAASAGTTAAPTATAPPAPTPPSAPTPPPATAQKPNAPATLASGPLAGTTEPLSRLRKVIAQRMVESLQVSAQLTTVVEVDVTRIAAVRKRVKTSFEQREGVKLSFMPFFVKASVEALKQYPQINASIDIAAGTVTYYADENIGIAVDTERGLLVPVIHQAGDLNVAGIARQIADLAERTRTGKVSPDDLSGGTFTVTNTGSRGALFDTPIVNLPQVAILGTGAVVKRPVAVTDDNGQDVIAIRSMVYLALSYDHRLVDGADAARFLSTMKARLEEATFDAELGL